MLLAPGFFAFVEAHIKACFADIERIHVDLSINFSLSRLFSA
jgi:hypothetical protein